MPADVIQRNTQPVTYSGFSHHSAVKHWRQLIVSISHLRTCWTDLISANRCWQTLSSAHSTLLHHHSNIKQFKGLHLWETSTTKSSSQSWQLNSLSVKMTCASVGPQVIFYILISIFNTCRLFLLVYHYITKSSTLFLVYLMWTAKKGLESRFKFIHQVTFDSKSVTALTSAWNFIRSNFPKRPSCWCCHMHWLYF